MLALRDGVAADDGCRNASETSADGFTVGAGPDVGTSSVSELQAAMTATRASPAVNRASPRDARLTGRCVESGIMQEAAPCDQRGSGDNSTGHQHQAKD